jgi:hypothetical protein
MSPKNLYIVIPGPAPVTGAGTRNLLLFRCN